MNTKILSCLMIFLMAFSACQRDDFEEKKETQTTQTTNTGETKTEIPTSEGSTTSNTDDLIFKNGDKISIFPTTLNANGFPDKTLPEQIGVYENEKFKWTSSAEKSRIVACYPQAFAWQVAGEGWEKKREIHLQEDQSTEELFRQTNIYSAKKDIDHNDNSLKDLEFSSIYAQIDIKLSSDQLSINDLSKANVEIKSQSYAELDLFTNELKSYGNFSEKWIKSYYKGDGVFSVLIFPQNIEEYHYKSWITVNLNGRELKFAAPLQIDGEDFLYLKQGQKVKVNLKIEWDDLSVYSNQKKWVYGVIPPTENQWKTTDFAPYFKNVPWYKNSGWYDCKKSLIKSSNGDDSNMCWAASASDLLHWWMDHNQKYLNLYHYNGPRNFKSPLESEIFEFYKKYYSNSGRFFRDAVQHFMRGYSDEASGGYFKDVFKDKLPVTTMHFANYGVDNKTRFNKALIQAIEQKQGIELTTSNHSLVIWGIEFGEDGYISHLYYVDNNDITSFGSQFPGIKRNAVTYHDERIWLDDPMYKYNQAGAYIDQLNFLSLGTEQWENYFKKKN